MNLTQVNIYRILHIENIPHILENGITHKDSSNANPNFIGIGDLSLINNRNTKQVSINNGNTIHSIETVTLGDFTPFYFGFKMPMLYVVQRGGNFVEKASKPEDVVYLACPVEAIINSELVYYFSDGHATDFLSSFYNKDKVNQLPEIVCWTAVKEPYWSGQENLNIKRKKQAEFLVQGDIPPDFVIGYVCFNDLAKQKLVGFGIDDEWVKVIPNAYY